MTTPIDRASISQATYRRDDAPAPRLRSLVRFAVLAPSGHNTQPWRFRVAGDALELWADRTRSLPVSDGDGRELIISCGAALYNIRAAMRHYGHAGDVQLLPEPASPDLLARIRFGGPHVATLEDEALFGAIPLRATHRLPFDAMPLAPHVLASLRRAAAEEGAWLATVEPGIARDTVAELVAEGDRLQAADPGYREELALWIRPNHTRRPDGVPGYALGLSELASLAGPVMMEIVPWGGVQARRDAAAIRSAPSVVVLGTDGDNAREWLAAGQAVQRMLLRATTQGVGASFLNQPVQLPGLRALLREALGVQWRPQLVLRLGYGAPPPRQTPRRPPSDVMEN
jgi:nitroreductase